MPGPDIIHLPEEKGADVTYHDPYAPSFHREGMETVKVRDLGAALDEADCVAITTDHSVADWNEIAEVASNGGGYAAGGIMWGCRGPQAQGATAEKIWRREKGIMRCKLSKKRWMKLFWIELSNEL